MHYDAVDYSNDAEQEQYHDHDEHDAHPGGEIVL